LSAIGLGLDAQADNAAANPIAANATARLLSKLIASSSALPGQDVKFMAHLSRFVREKTRDRRRFNCG
jgi:hypothetical protein